MSFAQAQVRAAAFEPHLRRRAAAQGRGTNALPRTARGSDASARGERRRYARSARTSVSSPFSAELVRARPKSHILRSQLAFSSRFDGFRSRCSTFAE